MKRNILGVLALAVVALVGVSFASAFQFGEQELTADMLEHRDEVRKAIENEDYETWKSLMEEQITEERFNILVEEQQERKEHREAMEEARESGDYETMKELRGDNGFNRKMRGFFDRF